jgi:hypothetical protein
MYMRTVQPAANRESDNPLVPFRCDASRDLGTPEANVRKEKEKRKGGDRKKQRVVALRRATDR